MPSRNRPFTQAGALIGQAIIDRAERKRKEKEAEDKEKQRRQSQRTFAGILVQDADDKEKQTMADLVDAGGTGTQAAAEVKERRKEKESKESEANERDKVMFNQEMIKEQRRMGEVDRQQLAAGQPPQYNQEAVQGFERGQAAGLTGDALSEFAQDPGIPEWRLKMFGGMPEPEPKPPAAASPAKLITAEINAITERFKTREAQGPFFQSAQQNNPVENFFVPGFDRSLPGAEEDFKIAQGKMFEAINAEAKKNIDFAKADEVSAVRKQAFDQLMVQAEGGSSDAVQLMLEQLAEIFEEVKKTNRELEEEFRALSK